MAVKVLHGQHAEDRTQRDRFFRGARKMASLRHPHIVQVLEPRAEADDWYFFVMELVDGPNFERAVLQGLLTTEQKLRIVIEIGEALELAHSRGIIHRDVKPSNILLDEKLRPKLTDFDLVRADDSAGMTKTQAMMGTLQFAAPEALMSAKDAGPAADVYSLASTTIFALRGKALPRDYYQRPETTVKVLGGSKHLATLLIRSTKSDKRHRPKTVAMFVRELKVLQQLTSRAARGTAASRKLRPRVIVNLAAGVILVLVLSLLYQQFPLFENSTLNHSMSVPSDRSERTEEEPAEDRQGTQTPGHTEQEVEAGVVAKDSAAGASLPAGDKQTQPKSENITQSNKTKEAGRETQDDQPTSRINTSHAEDDLIGESIAGDERSQSQENKGSRSGELEKKPPAEANVDQRSELSDLGIQSSSPARRDDIVINDAGIPPMLITTRATHLYEKPHYDSISLPVALVKYWYVLPPVPGRILSRSTSNGFYRVATGLSESDFKGWLAEDDVVLWRQRQALRPTSQHGRELIVFLASREEAIEAAQTGDIRRATNREPASSGQLAMMPVLEAEEVRIAGKINRIYKVAIVLPDLTQAQVLAQSTIDVVFVVDTTTSMVRPIRQLRGSVARVTRYLKRRPGLDLRMRFGLVGYRDTTDGTYPGPMEYLTKVICDLDDGADHELFEERLAAMEVSDVASADQPEDILAGLATAMDNRLGWNPYAWRIIVVVAGSSAKTPDHPDPSSRTNAEGRTLRSISNQAAGIHSPHLVSSFVISAVLIKDPLFPEDNEVAERQLSQLVAGRSYNGRMISVEGGADPDDFSAIMTGYLLEAWESFEEVILRPETLRSRHAPDSVTTTNTSHPVLDLLRRLPDENTDQGAHVVTRYCTELDAFGDRVVIPYLFVRRGQLKTFASFIDFVIGYLEDAGEPGLRDVDSLLVQLESLSAALHLTVPLSRDTELYRVLTGIFNYPIRTSIFSISFGELAAMSEDRFQEWVRVAGILQEKMKGILNNEQLWLELHPGAQDRDAHAFVALSDLP